MILNELILVLMDINRVAIRVDKVVVLDIVDRLDKVGLKVSKV